MTLIMTNTEGITHMTKLTKEQHKRADDLWHYLDTECQLAYEEGLPPGVILGVVKSYLSTLEDIWQEVNG